METESKLNEIIKSVLVSCCIDTNNSFSNINGKDMHYFVYRLSGVLYKKILLELNYQKKSVKEMFPDIEIKSNEALGEAVILKDRHNKTIHELIEKWDDFCGVKEVEE